MKYTDRSWRAVALLGLLASPATYGFAHFPRPTRTMLIRVPSISNHHQLATVGTKDDHSCYCSRRTPLLFAETESSVGIDILDEVDAIFDAIDTNSDGMITLEELRSHLVGQMGYTEEYTTYLFASIDTDSNGTISRDEMKFAFYNFEALSMYMTFGMGGAEITNLKAFKDLALKNGFDKEDRDKLLLNDLADLIFNIIDTDASGEISTDELKAHFAKVTARLSKVASGEEDDATESQAEDYVDTMFATLDLDKDGGISREEIRSAFEKYDFKLLARTFGLQVYQSPV